MVLVIMCTVQTGIKHVQYIKLGENQIIHRYCEKEHDTAVSHIRILIQHKSMKRTSES